ncbi:hypothetical protein BYT27DRAFT_7197809 [Phlegmacium glaucopus]|nr:hypothetical protein BYT27DRAFT_7197809 [Phlegmacium glaucopus]
MKLVYSNNNPSAPFVYVRTEDGITTLPHEYRQVSMGNDCSNFVFTNLSTLGSNQRP